MPVAMARSPLLFLLFLCAALLAVAAGGVSITFNSTGGPTVIPSEKDATMVVCRSACKMCQVCGGPTGPIGLVSVDAAATAPTVP
ncbi:hypothetical protein KUF71_023595 [Frankliniella fusca]|uniref:Uncharacterized protein n=1 Tax=Frankliniella fusca TaxID=407009 RepID=A0AAE1LDI7_9NEOP|nr:hypothetical protein KUF71_023595 [Frankliniella fusca]